MDAPTRKQRIAYLVEVGMALCAHEDHMRQTGNLETATADRDEQGQLLRELLSLFAQ
jgi:hypothetical protein